MDPLTLIVLSMGSAAAVAGAIAWIANILINRLNPSSVAPRISAEMRDEIEQNGRWWDRQFHRLLASVGALDECPCESCVLSRLMLGSEDLRRAQWELGIPADGIPGPITELAITKGNTTYTRRTLPPGYTGNFDVDVQIRRSEWPPLPKPDPKAFVKVLG